MGLDGSILEEEASARATRDFGEEDEAAATAIMACVANTIAPLDDDDRSHQEEQVNF